MMGQPPAHTQDGFDSTLPDRRKNLTAGLIKVTPRMVLYREITNPTGLGRFDSRQK